MAVQIDSPTLASLSKAALLPSPVIPETFKPTIRLSVSFNDKAVAAGNLFRASECKATPTVSFTPEVIIPYPIFPTLTYQTAAR